MNLEDLIGKKVSILITGKDNKKEAYTGTITEIDEDFIYLKFFDDMVLLKGIYIRRSAIESIWIYKEVEA